MIRTIIITLLTLFLLITFIIFKPTIKLNMKNKTISIQSFWIVSSIGAILILVCGCIDFKSLQDLFNFSQSINPLKILILFISISLLSIVLEKAGFFELCVVLTTKKVKKSQIKLFIVLYSLIAILTMFTSNDIIILTFTPFIIYFCNYKKINPIPYLVGEFVAANSLSLMFVIGNPTNIYIANFYNIGFFEYFKTMCIPTLVLSIVGFMVTFLLFYKELKKPMEPSLESLANPTYNRHLIIVGLIHLVLCTICLVISSYLQIEMWYICLAFALSISIYIIIYDLVNHTNNEISIIKKAPWNLIPFVLSMFIIVLAMKQNDVLSHIALFFNHMFSKTKATEIFGYGLSSCLSCSLINNIPMSVAFSSILKLSSSGISSIYATIIGSNIGAILTPVGSLAGIMWLKYLKELNVNYSFKSFIKNGCIITIPVMICGLIALLLVI